MPLSKFYRAFDTDRGQNVPVDENELFPEPQGQQVAELGGMPPAPMVRPDPLADAELPPADPKAQERQYFDMLRKRYEGDVSGGNSQRDENRVTREDLDDSRDRQGLNTLIGGLSESAAKIGNYRGEYDKSTLPAYTDALNKQDSSYMDARSKLSAAGDDRSLKGQQGQVALAGAQSKYRGDEAKQANEVAMQDPNSDVSKQFRSILAAAGFPAPETASASMIEKSKFGSLVAEKYNKEQDRKMREAQSFSEEAGRTSRNDADNARALEVARLTNSTRESMGRAANETRMATAGQKGEGSARKEAGQLRTQYQSDPVVKNSTQLRVLNTQLENLARNPTGASDQALITLFTKSLDPTSVVRESEFAMSANNSGVVNKWSQMMDKAKSGRELTPEQRAEMVSVAKTIASGLLEEANKKRAFYSDLATQAGAEPWTVVGRDGEPSTAGAIGSQTVGEAPANAPAPAAGQREVYDPNSYGGRTQTGSR